MENNQIYFNVKDDKVKLSYKNPMTITDFITVVSTGILSVLQSVVQAAPEADRQAIQEDLYDIYNAAASNTLHYFAPEIDMRPHLTAQAILDAENQLIEKEYQRSKKDPTYHSPLAQADKPQLKVIEGGK